VRRVLVPLELGDLVGEQGQLNHRILQGLAAQVLQHRLLEGGVGGRVILLLARAFTEVDVDDHRCVVG